MHYRGPCSPERCFTRRVSRPAERLRVVHTRSTASVAASCQEDIAHGSTPGLTKKVVSSVVACAGAALADPLMSLVDTAFVGRLGVLQLAALGPNGALFNVVFFLGFSALGVVATNQISAAHGAGDRRAAGQSLILSCTVAFGLGILITAILVMAPCSALQLFQTNPEMMPYAKEYCVIRALGVSSALLMVVFQAAFRAVEDMRTPLIVVATSGLLNAILDPILIYPLQMGIAGAAWATAASQVAGASVFAGLVYSKRHIFGLPQAWEDAKQAAVSQAWSKAAMAASQTLQTHPDDHHTGNATAAKQHDDVLPQPQQQYTAAPHLVYPEANARAPRSMSPVARAAAPGGTAAIAPSPIHFKEPGTFHTALALFQRLPWDEFIATTLKLAVRCLLVLSTWTFASIAATAVGTYTMAAYQIMQQVLQLQLSVCWAFLAVGQSLVGVAIARGSNTSNDAHNHPRTTQKPASSDMNDAKKPWNTSQRDARVVGTRVVGLAIAASLGMAAITFALRSAVPRLFTSDASVLKLVEGSALMMCLMLAISWNNAIEGVLLGAGDTQFVINIYPVCVFAFLLALAGSVAAGWGLVGIWAALVLYYLGLSGTLSARYWVQRFRCKI